MSIKHISFVAKGVIKTAYIDQYPCVMLTSFDIFIASKNNIDVYWHCGWLVWLAFTLFTPVNIHLNT